MIASLKLLECGSFIIEIYAGQRVLLRLQLRDRSFLRRIFCRHDGDSRSQIADELGVEV